MRRWPRGMNFVQKSKTKRKNDTKMKKLIIMMMAALALMGCVKEVDKAALREQSEAEVYELAESLLHETQMLVRIKKSAADTRKYLSSEKSPGKIAILQEDLRAKMQEVTKSEEEIAKRWDDLSDNYQSYSEEIQLAHSVNTLVHKDALDKYAKAMLAEERDSSEWKRLDSMNFADVKAEFGKW